MELGPHAISVNESLYTATLDMLYFLMEQNIWNSYEPCRSPLFIWLCHVCFPCSLHLLGLLLRPLGSVCVLLVSATSSVWFSATTVLEYSCGVVYLQKEERGRQSEPFPLGPLLCTLLLGPVLFSATRQSNQKLKATLKQALSKKKSYYDKTFI